MPHPGDPHIHGSRSRRGLLTALHTGILVIVGMRPDCTLPPLGCDMVVKYAHFSRVAITIEVFPLVFPLFLLDVNTRAILEATRPLSFCPQLF